MRRLGIIILTVWILPFGATAQSGLCGGDVPFFSVDLIGSVDSSYISPLGNRKGQCCGSSAPDRCIEFQLTLDSAAVGIIFDIYSGAQPPGALYYQVNCGPAIPIGQPICLSGSGPHTLTFCKPGNNINQYSITSMPAYTQPPDVATVLGCDVLLTSDGLIESSITWHEITSGVGKYDPHLSCTNGCSQTTFTAIPGMPPYLDIELNGILNTSYCTSLQDTIVDTIRIFIHNQPDVSIIPDPATLCVQDSNRLLNSFVNYYSHSSLVYEWSFDSLGVKTVIGNDTFFIASKPGTYTLKVYDSLFTACSVDSASTILTVAPDPVLSISGNDTICQF